ncbi:MAG TPA: phospholipase D-like domain-containing protein [Chthoniobacterales bacterium]|nr:phospholipase D-like domain-containing protein [Chthoniobacterales bacterium]
MKRRPEICEPSWKKVWGTAALSSAVAVLIVRNFFETEKKIRHPIRADYAAGDDTFVRTMGQLLGPPLVEGNSVTILQNGDEIFPAMLEGIRSATQTITFENFLLKEGRVWKQFATALEERARAGVKVHFLQDAFGSNCLRGEDMKRLRRSGAEVEIFRFYQLSQMNFRTHRKLLTIDGRIGFIGGAGIADAWSGDGKTHGLWRDSHYRLEGPVVAQVQQAFTENWMETRAVVLHGDDYFPKLEESGAVKAQVFRSAATEGADSARMMLLLSIAAARRHIRIANAYFIPDDLCLDTLVHACHRGVKVEIITPGPDIDAHLVRSVGKMRWPKLLKAGAHFYEYQPARFHCKYMIIDDCWSSVGSANLDNRSLRLNEEANLNVLDEGFAAQHIRIFEEDKSRSRRITLADWRRRPLEEKIKGAAGLAFRSQL